MTNLYARLIVLTFVLIAASPILAQQQRASPHETMNARIDGARDAMVTITYGRPLAKGRQVWGQLVPWGRAWRMGADEATLLLTQQALQFGDTVIPAGAHTLYLVPQENGPSKLAFSKKLGGWGIPVDETQDVARVDIQKTTVEQPVEQFTIAIDRNPSGGGILKLTWETTQFSAPFTVKR